MKFLPILVATLATPNLQAATILVENWVVSTMIPDNNDVGFSDTRTIVALGLDSIESISVDLVFSGGWNGDLYVYLTHDTGFSVLLNRPGRTSSSPDGSASSGMSITMTDSAPSEIHTAIPASGGPVTGTFQPDARIADPLLVVDTDPRTAHLSTFVGLDPNGSWTLFIADQSAGAVSTIESWSLTMTVVPEPSVLGFMSVLTLGALARRRRSKN